MDYGKRTLQFFKATFQHAEGKPGSWRATLFFVYSRKITFSPIRSQNVPKPHPAELEPIGSCSPKSAFVLAEKVRVLVVGALDWDAERLG